MTVIIDDSDSTPWKDSYLIDRLKQHLSTIERPMTDDDIEDYKNNRFFDARKYYDQAHKSLIFGALKPVPRFLVHLSDLSKKLINELCELDKESREYVIKQAVGRIFEDINCDLYHDSISKVLKVELRNE